MDFLPGYLGDFDEIFASDMKTPIVTLGDLISQVYSEFGFWVLKSFIGVLEKAGVGWFVDDFMRRSLGARNYGPGSFHSADAIDAISA